jgi:hypothetical protein
MTRVLWVTVLMASLVSVSVWGGTSGEALTPVSNPRVCQVEPGWWSSSTQEGHTLEFHITPDGAQVDTVRIALYDMCGFSGGYATTSYGVTGTDIEGDPCGFTWQSDCRLSPPPPTPGWEARVQFGVNGGGGHDALAEVDVTYAESGCPYCLTLEFLPNPTPVEMTTWGSIKTAYH